jgi:phospholipid/cholesterol/gamma-HCH transport system substrate-binding protein
MKKESGNKVKLGLFVVGGLAIILAGIYFIGQKQRLFSSTIHITTVYKDVNGLEVGNNIRYAGINVGTVDDIKITSDSTVMVSMAIDKSVKKFIKKDSRAGIGSEGLMGDKNINLTTGSDDAQQIANNDTILSVDGTNIDAIMKSIKTTADNAAVITTDLSAVIGNLRAGKGTIGKLFMDTVFAGNLDATLGNVKKASGSLKEDMVAAQHNFLLRGFFKKKEREEKKRQDSIADADKKENKR